jgi:hypothetical protein
MTGVIQVKKSISQAGISAEAEVALDLGLVLAGLD